MRIPFAVPCRRHPLALAPLLPRAELLVVTPPSLPASRVARRAVSMARNNYLRVIGVVENLSSYVAPDGSNHEIFGSGGGEFLAHESGVPLLGKIPIEPAGAQGGDDGKPGEVQLGHIDASAAPPSPAARAFGELARLVATEVSPPIEMAGCTAHFGPVDLETMRIPGETVVQLT